MEKPVSDTLVTSEVEVTVPGCNEFMLVLLNDRFDLFELTF
jgi:hypothetical protein